MSISHSVLRSENIQNKMRKKRSPLVDPQLLKQFLDSFKGVEGSPNEYNSRCHLFKDAMALKAMRNGLQEPDAKTWASEQMDIVACLLPSFCHIAMNFGLIRTPTANQTKPPGAGPSGTIQLTNPALPIDDSVILTELVEAMAENATQIDMVDTAPYKHWRHDMSTSDFQTIAKRFLV
jgi:hypothetical protein